MTWKLKKIYLEKFIDETKLRSDKNSNIYDSFFSGSSNSNFKSLLLITISKRTEF